MRTLRWQPYGTWRSLRQRLAQLPASETEESITLRLLTQAVVALGIIAVDLTAGTALSLWAIPLSLGGGVWSWARRRRTNVAAKFMIALGMLGSLVLFLGGLVENLNDTRLVLAELLIRLQVLHSFDLPRRKDLGYSLVIGLILLSVAATLSETLAFAPLLLLFFLVALPALLYDYRARLGFDQGARWGRRSQGGASPASPPATVGWRRLGLLMVLTLALGLVIFALMPRFPGYQLQNFPVSGGAELEEQWFTEQTQGIFNPGVSEGNQTEAEGLNQAAGTGSGEDTGGDDVYYGFRTQMDQLGLNPSPPTRSQVVLRVRSQAPGFWRTIAFDRYTGRGWEISDAAELSQIERPPWTYRFDLGLPGSESETQAVIQTVTVVRNLPNLIPALSQPRALYFPTPEVGIDSEGSLRAPAILATDMTYTVVSDVPRRDRTLLGQARTDYNPITRRRYLQLPEAVAAQVRPEAEALLAKSPQPLTNSYEKALFLAQALKQTYEIRDDFPVQPGEDLVAAFLRQGGGYPDHFSTVLAVMLRSLGIPARLSAGFAPSQFNPFTGFYLVHNTDAFALPEVYFFNHGWFAFDPVPGRELIPPSVEDVEMFSVLEQFWRWVAGWLPSPVTGFLSWLWLLVVGTLSRGLVGLWQFISGSAVGVLMGAIGAIAISFAAWLAGQRLRSWRDDRRLRRLPPMERLYQQLQRDLAAQGLPRHPAQTPLEYARCVEEQRPGLVAEVTATIAQAYARWRYGAIPPDLDRLQAELRRLRRTRASGLVRKP